ncbi:hypothetical protein B0J13DRAFT_520147 [Dactylonectria estremocensis]|uniref:Uncharacterized protein n=1 Tax=Dactylonectria estremocensis TaxID=1079267 RepID=A0A9P9JAY7_9HYPO|nr:hypothetical protein B0J13DRAFT_520147 [Dactylonectria estremocensis]
MTDRDFGSRDDSNESVRLLRNVGFTGPLSRTRNHSASPLAASPPNVTLKEKTYSATKEKNPVASFHTDPHELHRFRIPTPQNSVDMLGNETPHPDDRNQLMLITNTPFHAQSFLHHCPRLMANRYSLSRPKHQPLNPSLMHDAPVQGCPNYDLIPQHGSSPRPHSKLYPHYFCPMPASPNWNERGLKASKSQTPPHAQEHVPIFPSQT